MLLVQSRPGSRLIGKRIELRGTSMVILHGVVSKHGVVSLDPSLPRYPDAHLQQEEPLHRNVQRSRGGLVFKAHRLVVSLNSESYEEEERTSMRYTTRQFPHATYILSPMEYKLLHISKLQFQKAGCKTPVSEPRFRFRFQKSGFKTAISEHGIQAVAPFWRGGMT